MSAGPDGPEDVPEAELLAPYPPPAQITPGFLAEAVAASGRRVAVFDDDPTGTQTVADVPVLTSWGIDDLRWALRQDSPAFYVLTNTRSLSEPEATARNREVTAALVAASAAEGVKYAIASRGDSTLRGHFPLETDAIEEALGETGVAVDGVVIAPAYVEGGRMTLDSVHWLRTAGGMRRVGRSEFARDATFGYHASDLRDYVEEKTAGRWKAADVARITLQDLRMGGLPAVGAVLGGLRGARPVVVDAVTDDDLRVLSLGLLAAEGSGRTFLYRVGPSFVRARAGLEARPPLGPEEIEAIRARRQGPGLAAHGLVVVGSHVGQTTRQLAGLRGIGGIEEIEIDVRRVLDPASRSAVVADAVSRATAGLDRGDVVISTSREVVTGPDADASLAIARSVSAALVEVVGAVVARRVPLWIVGKGGITASDLATDALGIRRAWVRGTLLPGIVSLWEPVTAGVPEVEHVPYVVFAGNVGDDAALAAAVTTLRGGHAEPVSSPGGAG
ncbi:MAG: hypothetical protein J2O47_02725 [Acidimicrobiaceae bacterium]|nr:hypothetical protein [Acidimicrobiaceae bacterium]